MITMKYKDFIMIDFDTKYFMMSFRFNKETPKDFGLIKSNSTNIYISPLDKSLWKKRNLYDFGWGNENGYYRLPLGEFEDLIDIILNTNSDENKYGAAAVILDDYCDKLLIKCQELLKDNMRIKEYLEFFKILKLDISINRSNTHGKNFKEVSKEFDKWKDISEQIQSLLKINNHKTR